MRYSNFELSASWILVYDGEEGQNNEGQNNEGLNDDSEKKEEKKEDRNKVFTQEQVNKMLAEDRRKHQKQVEVTVAELERFKKSKGLSDKEKTELQGRIEELNNSLLTKEELARKEQEKLRNEHKSILEKVSGERDSWQNRFVSATITRSIMDEAVRAEAFNPTQIVTILKGNTRLVEVLDSEGNPVPDEFVAKVRFNDTDKEGKPVTLDLTIQEALKRMKDRADEYGNLFKSGVAGGIGASGNRGAGGRTIDPKTATPEQWRKMRKEMGLGRKG